MRRGLLLTGAMLAVSSSLALAAPESLLPPSFDNPAPTPAPRPAPAPAPAQAPAPSGGSTPVIQAIPTAPPASGEAPASVSLPSNFPSLRELEAMDDDAFAELFGLKPKFDIPAGARRDVRQVGVIDRTEGGFAAGLLDQQPAALVRAALAAHKGPMVSRWGHILLRRALASRMDAPQGMNPVDFVALRAGLLNRMGEGAAARTLVQDVDSANYNTALANAAFDAYLATGDILGICPVARLKSTLREDAQWNMARAICDAFGGEGRQADRELQRIFYYGEAPRVDALLAQRYAGAAGEGRRSVTIEWDDVDELNPWRFALTRSLGIELPEKLRRTDDPRYAIADVFNPAVPLGERAAAGSRIAASGVLSSSALVDLYSQVWADGTVEGESRDRAGTLRDAYVARSAADRLAALRQLWGGGDEIYGGQVLTAYAAARLPASEDLVDDAPLLIGSMLAAGLDRNAMRWGTLVPEGSQGWALLALAQPDRRTQVSGGAVDTFIEDDDSAAQRKSRFLVAGLAGLGRLDMGTANNLASRLGVNLGRESAWSRKIDRAAQLRNPALVALLAGVGMQGDSWDKMTARYLFHIVRALNQVGLDAEARMIAAEAVARG